MQFYRYVLSDVSRSVGPIDIPDIQIDLQIYNLEKETPKGYWIQQSGWFNRNWISKTSKKRFAYPTKEEALNNFVRRTEKRLKICQHQAEICKLALAAIKENDIIY